MAMDKRKTVLIAAIHERPNDLGLRRAYAALAERDGDPALAQLIRAECALSEAAGDETRRDELDQEIYDLRCEHEERWMAGYRGRGVFGIDFRYGLIEGITATAPAFLRGGEDWVKSTPLRNLSLTSVAGLGRRLATFLPLNYIRRLTIQDERLADKVIIALACSPHLRRLDHLLLEGGAITDVGAVALANTPALESLTALFIAGSCISDTGLQALLESPFLLSLKTLNLEGSRVVGDALTTLMDASSLLKLGRLCLRKSRIETIDLDIVAAVLARHPRLYLDLSDCPLSEPMADELAARFGGQIWLGLRYFSLDKMPGHSGREPGQNRPYFRF